jgi:hypothetical protein
MSGHHPCIVDWHRRSSDHNALPRWPLQAGSAQALTARHEIQHTEMTTHAQGRGSEKDHGERFLLTAASDVSRAWNVLIRAADTARPDIDTSPEPHTSSLRVARR